MNIYAIVLTQMDIDVNVLIDTHMCTHVHTCASKCTSF